MVSAHSEEGHTAAFSKEEIEVCHTAANPEEESHVTTSSEE